MYSEEQLVRVAKRENNSKRSYLVVNALQGKHLPVPPGEALQLFGALAELVKTGVAGQRVLVVGFAETATAIGSAVAAALGCPYLQTTRETVAGHTYLHFTEAHSHATEQKLSKSELAQVLPEIDRIIFAEDELTTGNTILKLVDTLEREFQRQFQYGAACLLSGMTPEAVTAFQERGVALYALLSIGHDGYHAQALSCPDDGRYHCPPPVPAGQEGACTLYSGRLDARGLIRGDAYRAACEALWQDIRGDFPVGQGERILVLGTEEFMYPGLYAAAQMERLGAVVRYHATTRSPIAVSAQTSYPLHSRFELRSLYDSGRTTFVYELDAYDSVYIITDAPAAQTEGLRTLVAALRQAGNETIHVIRWCDS